MELGDRLTSVKLPHEKGEIRERSIACLTGLAVGDALGKQTESLSHADVRKWYPQGLAGFVGEPGTVIPRYSGKRYEWKVGETTDDTEQTIAVGKALLRAEADHKRIGEELLRCRKSVHPGVRIWEFQQVGEPARIATEGDGCGAAMRVAPIGLTHAPEVLETIAHGAIQSSLPTHGGQFGICAAAAVAGAVAAAIEGSDTSSVLKAAVESARLAETIRPSPSTLQSRVGDSTQSICDWLASRKTLSAEEIAANYFPTDAVNIVPLAVGLALVTESAEETSLLAVNVGGDADSVASIGSAIAAALHPAAVNPSWFRVVCSINPVECDALIELASALAVQRVDQASGG
jgi:ADP-ribosylglycohydrolase